MKRLWRGTGRAVVSPDQTPDTVADQIANGIDRVIEAVRFLGAWCLQTPCSSVAGWPNDSERIAVIHAGRLKVGPVGKNRRHQRNDGLWRNQLDRRVQALKFSQHSFHEHLIGTAPFREPFPVLFDTVLLPPVSIRLPFSAINSKSLKID